MTPERLTELRELQHGSADGMVRELISEIDHLRSLLGQYEALVSAVLNGNDVLTDRKWKKAASALIDG